MVNSWCRFHSIYPTHRVIEGNKKKETKWCIPRWFAMDYGYDEFTERQSDDSIPFEYTQWVISFVASSSLMMWWEEKQRIRMSECYGVVLGRIQQQIFIIFFWWRKLSAICIWCRWRWHFMIRFISKRCGSERDIWIDFNFFDFWFFEYRNRHRDDG